MKEAMENLSKLPIRIVGASGLVKRTIWVDDPRIGICSAYNADAPAGLRAEYQPVSAAMDLASSNRLAE